MKKFEEVIDVFDYQVETDIGYVDIEKSMITEEYEVYEISLETKNIKCADKHILITDKDEEVFAMDSLGYKIKTKTGFETVTKVESLGYTERMYDLQLANHHKFYTNEILSHNTTVVGGYLLHLALFNKNFTIACLANKHDQAREILSRIQLMYERLPWWLQMGVKTWNKGDIHLGNGTKIFTAATGGSAVRGKSLNCFGGNTVITVQRKDTKAVKNVTFEQLEKELHADVFTETSIS